VIAYGSRLLTKPEHRYCVTPKELLAVVYFIDQYRLGHKFILWTDQWPLSPVSSMAGEIAGVRFHYWVQARNNADALSSMQSVWTGYT
jgi:hypothetical protein